MLLMLKMRLLLALLVVVVSGDVIDVVAVADDVVVGTAGCCGEC